jgi:hypothetical protein
MTEDQVITIMEIYLKCTIIEHDHKYYQQKSGVPIGSSLGSILCDIYMAAVDLSIWHSLKPIIEQDKLSIDRFVDDFKALYHPDVSLDEIRNAFANVGFKLTFTMEEESAEEGLQVLDVNFKTKGGLCYIYQQRSQKPVLPYRSHHSKAVFNGIIIGAIRNAMARSCDCCVGKSIKQQEERLQKAGYPVSKINEAKRKLLSQPAKKEWERKPMATMPNYHGFTNRTRRSAASYQVGVASTYDHKLSGLTMKVEKLRDKTSKKIKCNQKSNIFPCVKNVVYQVGMTCKKAYVGETSKCANQRLDEHIKGDSKYATFNSHAKKCGCSIDGKSSTVISSEPILGNHVRKISETLHMERLRDKNGADFLISSPSVIPTKMERRFIQNRNVNI